MNQNLFTWILWVAVDFVIAASVITQGGNFLLPVAYTVGSAITAFFIFASESRASWTWIETVVALLVVASMGVWVYSGSKLATIASTTAMIIAGIPQLVDAWKKPREMPMPVFVSYFIANSLSAAGGKNWSIEERFFPVALAFYCVAIIFCSARRFWLKSAVDGVVH
ncbi:MAG: hypothetical protein AAB581_00525 [Patescibacteria group bacterium]